MKAGDDVGYYRYPTIHGDDITFVSADDLWCAPASGGTARRLTANPGSPSFPAYSPDGRFIAYTSTDDGPSEVYVMPADGGPPRRLTWLGSLTQVVGWTPDGRRVIFASNWQQPFQKAIHLHAVDVRSGVVESLNVGPARALSHAPGGRGLVLGRNSGDPARWKRYRGGTAGTLWIDRNGGGNFRPLVKLDGNLASPMWIGDRIYFLSDHEGFGNLYSCTPAGRDIVRHTHHEDYYVRFPSTDGRRIAYHCGADLWLYDVDAGKSHEVAVRIASARSQRNRRFVSAQDSLESADLHPQGHSIAIVARGGAFTMGLWDGASARHGEVSGVRHRLASWLPDGRRIVAVSDEGGDESLVVVPVDGKGRSQRLNVRIGRPVALAVSPKGSLVAVANERHQLSLVDLEAGTAKKIERSEYDRIAGMSFSSDGRWLAYGFPTSHYTSVIRLLDTETGKVHSATRPEFRDVQPSFDPEGKYLYFLSWRFFDPVYDNLYFDLGFPRGAKPCLLPLQRDTPSPFDSANRPPRAPAADEPDERHGEGKGSASKSPVTQIDLDGLADRVVAFPVADGNFGRVIGTRGQVLWSVFPIEGSLEKEWMDSGEPPAEGTLEVYDFDKQKTDTVVDMITDFTVAMDAPVLGVRCGNRIRAIHATHRDERQAERKDEPGRESGWVDLERLRVAVNPPEEWRQMYREAWRLQRDHFWTQDMSGVDWKRIYERYLPLVDRCASRSEFSDLLWELQGELGTSHCYELGGDYRPEPDWFQGFLGADLERDERGGWSIARIPRGDSWDPKQSSPLAAPGLEIEPGHRLLAIDGQKVDRRTSPHERLVNLAGEDVKLTVRPGPPGKKGGRPGPARTVAIHTLKEEFSLRYRDWVETNRARVHDESKGRVGYVHIPNMGPVGYAEFHRYYINEVHRDGLIIDVRFNGGGHVSQLILEKLLRRRVGWDLPRWGRPESYPAHAPAGPMVALTNEYAGSDGDIFSHAFKLYGLGPLIGKRTWGGVIGIWPRHSLVDGTVTTQAEFASWFEDVGWGVENYGTDPDIEVDIKPQDHAAGRDPQMERALSEIRKRLGKKPLGPPRMDERPDLKPRPLPRSRRRGRR